MFYAFLLSAKYICTRKSEVKCVNSGFTGASKSRHKSLLVLVFFVVVYDNNNKKSPTLSCPIVKINQSTV